jgi:amino acid adenylation domain-containing protein
MLDKLKQMYGEDKRSRGVLLAAAMALTASTYAALETVRIGVRLPDISGDENTLSTSVEITVDEQQTFAQFLSRFTERLEAAEASGDAGAQGEDAIELRFSYVSAADRCAVDTCDLSFEFRADEPGVAPRITGKRAVELGDWPQWFWQGFGFLVSQVIENPDVALSLLNLCPDDHWHQQCATNSSLADYDADASVARTFARSVQERSDAVAIYGEARQWTWGNLDAQARQLAGWFTSNFDIQGRPFGVIVDRHESCVVAFLAIAMAGGIYVPVSSEAPLDRMKEILADCDAIGVLSISAPVPELPGSFFLEDIPLDAHADFEPVLRKGADPLYIMYTSGSTGKPKGVLVSHRNVQRLAGQSNYITWSKNDRVALMSTQIFDAATFEIWGALLNGVPLVSVPKHVLLDIDRLGEKLAADAITVAVIPSALLAQIAQRAPHVLGCLRYVLYGGESTPVATVRAIMAANPELELVHGYGPTENTTLSTYFKVDGAVPNVVPIGKPLTNSAAWIVDATGRPVPVGAVGGLVVGGDGVALGYLHLDQLTRERFVDLPMEMVADGMSPRGYITGDFARWNAEGQIEFLGRRDNQIKMRGYRIELEQIKEAIMKVARVNQAEVVAVKEGGEGYTALHAYYTGDALDPKEVLAAVSKMLPAYEVPSKLFHIPYFPISMVGKIDQQKLRELSSAPQTSAKAGPRNDLDEQLMVLWRDLLKTEEIGIDESFSSLGGYSMLLLDLSGALFDRLGVEYSLLELIALPSITELSDSIAARLSEEKAGV